MEVARAVLGTGASVSSALTCSMAGSMGSGMVMTLGSFAEVVWRVWKAMRGMY